MSNVNDVSNVNKRPYLVVDDDETCLELLKYILLDYGDHIRFESSSTAALSYVENNEIKVLLTDHRMPTLSGLELIRRVKQLYPECYVVLMSSFDDYTEVITEFNNKLLDQYLSKPVSKPDLYNVMDRVRRNLRGQKEVYNYGFVSQNKNVLKLLEMVPRAAKSGLPVMIV
ncbi:response regulator, partial [Oleiphilus sp. HI0067]